MLARARKTRERFKLFWKVLQRIFISDVASIFAKFSCWDVATLEKNRISLRGDRRARLCEAELDTQSIVRPNYPCLLLTKSSLAPTSTREVLLRCVFRQAQLPSAFCLFLTEGGRWKFVIDKRNVIKCNQSILADSF